MQQEPLRTYPHGENVISVYWRNGKASFEITVYDAKSPNERTTICAPTLHNLKLLLALSK